MEIPFAIKINQLRLERNYSEAVQLLQARLAQFHFASNSEKAGWYSGARLTPAPRWQYG